MADIYLTVGNLLDDSWPNLGPGMRKDVGQTLSIVYGLKFEVYEGVRYFDHRKGWTIGTQWTKKLKVRV